MLYRTVHGRHNITIRDLQDIALTIFMSDVLCPSFYSL